jgi:ubiquinol-cytochrome c reductase cytochrome c subunit
LTVTKLKRNSVAINKRHPLALFAILFVALGTTGVAYATVSGSTTPKVAAKSETQVEQGKQLFLEGCSSCHGLAAQGASDGPSLIGVGAASVDFQVGTGRMPLAAPGIQAMPGMASYNEEETAALAAYIATLGAGPGIPTAEMLDTTNAELALGGELFRTNCAQCHGAAGSGGALSEGRYAPSLMDTNAKYLYEAMVSGPQSMPVFADSTISVEDKQHIIAYVAELQTNKSFGGHSLGRLGPVTEGLFIFIAGLGVLVIAAVWIGAKAK